MECPDLKEPKTRIECTNYSITSANKAISSFVVESDNPLSITDERGVNTTSRIYLNESITLPSRQALLDNQIRSIARIYQILQFSNAEIFLTAFNIIQLCAIRNINDIDISKTSDNEMLLFRKKDGEFSNIVIDEDGDISYFFIGKKPGSEKTKYFPKKDGFDYSQLASLL